VPSHPLQTRRARDEVASLSLAGKTALITGGTRGIGRGVVLAMANAGAHVLISGRDEAKAIEVLQAVRGLGGTGDYILADLRDEAAMSGLVPAALEKGGSLDILVNNAGVSPDIPAIDYPVETWREVLYLDLEVPFRLAQAAARHFRTRGQGVIINISSVMGITTQPGECAYVAAKHGMHGMTKSMALEWAPFGVRVNAIAPGLIMTDMTAEWASSPGFQDRIDARYPVRRPGYPADIGGVAVFLASDAADFIQGQIIPVDGGRTAGSPDLPSFRTTQGARQ